MHPRTPVKARRILLESTLICALSFVAFLGPSYSPPAAANPPDICDLPGCGILEKAVDKGKNLFMAANNPLIDAGKAAATTTDLATDPVKYFAMMFANSGSKLIQELDGELRK
ncbi:hypothetical protein ACH4VR_29270 [Streptomyces sp. NPDC020883]|uniref:hypothetical protein n=1 Tax=Streptomyces sp. NPDC020883 TaxID=3365099 RepID=UPI0037A98B28